jgi:hypothetical protein
LWGWVWYNIPMEIPRRFARQINKTDTCWLWTGHINNVGYGRYNGKNYPSQYVHRAMFFWSNGYLPVTPNVVGHLCEVRNCVNPEHLTEQTQSANVRQYTERITHCPQGHEYSKENTSFKTNKKTGWVSRRCRACHAEAERQRRGK